MDKTKNRAEYMLEPFQKNENLIKERSRNGIENHRKGFATLKIITEDGKPAVGAKISVKQKTHDFKYGANLFMLDEFECEEKNQEYRKLFKEHFNFATLPFYWDANEPEKGKLRFAKDSSKYYRRPSTDLCLEYCEQNGITPKAHVLSTPGFVPEWFKKESAAEQWKSLETRYRLCAEHYANRIRCWEVTNELWHWEYFYKIYRDPLFMERSFFLAEKYFTQNEFMCNEGEYPFTETFYYNRDRYYMQIERAKLKGARIDTIGFQYHLWCTPENEENLINRQCDPNKIYRVFDTFSAFGNPFQITEQTFPCHDHTSTEAENVQAELLKNLYTIWFGTPNMEAAIYWNLVDGYAYGAKPGDFTNGENKLAGGLVRFDMTPKPALKELKKLFTETWHTEEQIVSDNGGVAKFKGFYGTYDVEVIFNGKKKNTEIHLEKYVSSDIEEFVIEV